MNQPWGLSGPEFLGLYACAFVLAAAAPAIVRTVRRGGRPDGPGTADVYTLAVVGGGDPRVVDTAVHALIEDGRLRASRDHKLTVCGGPPEEPVQRAVLDELHRAGPVNLTEARRLGRYTDPVQHIARTAVTRGLLVGPEERRRTAVSAIVPALVVVAVGIARLVNGVRLGRPVGLLVAALIVSAVAVVLLAAGTPRLTPAGEALLDRARHQDGPDPRAFGSYGWYDPHGGRPGHGASGLTAAVVPAAVLSVAALGATGVADADLRAALYGAMGGGSGGGGSSCGSGGGDGGGGGCGGGCGGCGG
ncbi:TIGR04222 domain-containing membrane protein [Streptomyces sp. CA-111067]|uniref:TIGR04222 domain-containing membrane protein n=1 Tax=Streptomyces sp. CA-111067 TaxID=3240046 RepID=UPI003D96668A